MKAVATVIANRVNATEGEYSRISQGGNVRNIIYQQGQFDCATETIFNRYNPQNIYNMNPTDIHYYIADWALSGNKLNEIGDCLWYLNPFRPDCSSTFQVMVQERFIQDLEIIVFIDQRTNIKIRKNNRRKENFTYDRK